MNLRCGAPSLVSRVQRVTLCLSETTINYSKTYHNYQSNCLKRWQHLETQKKIEEEKEEKSKL